LRGTESAAPDEIPARGRHDLSSKDDGGGTYDGQIGRANLHLDDGSTDQGHDLGFVPLAEAARIAAANDGELDVDGPTREQSDEPPRRSFLDRLRGR
jgi:hypothetical protein